MSKRQRRGIWVTALITMLAGVQGPVWADEAVALRTVLPAVETEAVAAAGDAADDAAIWVHPTDPDRSLVIATDKRTGLVVYDLAGRLVQDMPIAALNNVDLRVIGDLVVVAASDRTYEAVSLFLLDPATGRLTEAGRIPSPEPEPYGFCLFHDRADNALYAFVPHKSGALIQYRLWTEGGGLSGAPVRRVTLFSQLEGCVADDRTGQLYVGEEATGIWRLDASPMGSPLLHFVAAEGRDGLVADVEGLALAPEGDEGGHLIASSQGDNTYAVFALPEVRIVGRFEIGDNPALGIDGTSETDGIAVSVQPLGASFPQGLFVAQDDANDGADTQNFKFVPWERIASGLLPE